MVICLERGANDLHMVQLMPLPPPSSLASLKSRMVFTFLVPAYPGCPGKEAVKWVFVFVLAYVCYFSYVCMLRTGGHVQTCTEHLPVSCDERQDGQNYVVCKHFKLNVFPVTC